MLVLKVLLMTVFEAVYVAVNYPVQTGLTVALLALLGMMAWKG